MEKCNKLLALFIASLKAIYIIEQHSHWTTKGNDFYGDHLMFQRLYESAQADLDLAAEKFIGVFGAECLNYELQAELLNKVLMKYKDIENPIDRCLAVEKSFIQYSKQIYDYLDSEDKMTLGLDDAIMSIASKREESVYLLNQAKN